MGVSSSKIEDEKTLLLCRDRKHFVKQAIDGRCSLAAAHVAYRGGACQAAEGNAIAWGSGDAAACVAW